MSLGSPAHPPNEVGAPRPSRRRALLRSPLYLRMVASVAVVLLIPAVITSVYNVKRSSAARLEASQPQLLQSTEAKATAVEAILLRSISDVLFLGQAPPLQRYARDLSVAPAAPTEDVVAFFRSFLSRAGGLYDGLTVLDRTGQEQLVITVEGSNTRLVPREELRSRARETFFSGAMSLAGISGRLAPVYLSPVERAAGPDGTSLPPSGPSIHYASLLFTLDGSVAGVLVLSSPLKHLVRPLTPDEPTDHVYLVDTSGNYLAGSDAGSLDSGLGNTGANMPRVRPSDAKEILGRPKGTLLDTAERPGWLQAFARIRPAGQGTIQWTVVCERPLSVILAREQEIELVILATTVGSLMLALLVTLIFIRGIAHPINQLAAAAVDISRGRWEAPLPTRRRADEIGELTEAFARMAQQLQATWLDLQRNMDELRRSEAELEQRVKERTQELFEAQRRLVETARRAGREEISTTILHNVGNVASSLNIAVDTIRSRLSQSRVTPLSKALELVQTHASDLGHYFTEDPKGRILPSYLTRLAQNLLEEHSSVLTEMEGLQKSLDHINNIITVQQSLASRVAQVIEEVDVCATVDEALRIQLQQARDIEVVRDYEQLPGLHTDRHKLLEILINLLSNAQQALRASSEPRRLVVCVRNLGESVQIQVKDNGIGIAAEKLPRIFQFGFTDKKDGHGFGLHSCVLLARAMGGSLRAHSEGVGQGAAFTLELPWTPRSTAQPAPELG